MRRSPIMSAASVMATHSAAPISTAPTTAPVPPSSITSTTVSSAMPEIGDQSVMPVHCAMMMPASQIHATPTSAMVAARSSGGNPASQPGRALLLSSQPSLPAVS